MKKICLFGGTFNPIHIGHMNMARHVLDELGLDKLIFIPSGESYFKKGVLSSALRYEMASIGVKECFLDDSRVDVSDVEVMREGPSYSYETILHYKEIFPEDELFFLIGEDSVFSIIKWKKPDLIFSNANIIVCKRSDGVHDLIDSISRLEAEYNAHISVLEFDMPISSTYIRDNLYLDDNCRNLLPNSVYEYICEHELYK